MRFNFVHLFKMGWLLFNMLAGIHFGFLHQRGVPASLLLLHNSLSNISHCSLDPTTDSLYCGERVSEFFLKEDKGLELNTTIYFMKTYMPPEHLFPRQDGVLASSPERGTFYSHSPYLKKQNKNKNKNKTKNPNPLPKSVISASIVDLIGLSIEEAAEKILVTEPDFPVLRTDLTLESFAYSRRGPKAFHQ